MGKKSGGGTVDHYREFVKTFDGFRYKHDIYNVFRDFCELCAISISNAVLPDAKREGHYLDIVKRYDAESTALFPKLLAELTLAMEVSLDDHLGKAFNELEQSNKDRGQFFTPYSISRLMADLTVDTSLQKRIKQQGFVTVGEPACGSGGMIIALCHAMMDKGINYQQAMHVTAWDVDPRAAHMTYVQLALVHCPAIIVQGNTLTQEVKDVWRTPAHVMGFWDHKLKRVAAQKSVRRKLRLKKQTATKKRLALVSNK